jgi:Lipid A 3-O-deacylase (PagL)
MLFPQLRRFRRGRVSCAFTIIVVCLSSHAQEIAAGSSGSSASGSFFYAPSGTAAASSAPAGSGSSAVIVNPVALPIGEPAQRFGGIHEISIDFGISRVSGAMWGYRQDVKYEVVHLRYSREMRNARLFTAYYSPEVTPYAKLDEPVLTDDDMGSIEIGRKHTTGGGISPVGFTVDFLPRRRIQPFWAMNAGMIYFRDRVLSPQGSQFMYTIDFGGGLHLYTSHFVSTTIGFRFDHLSNANISLHNPGTDAELWYLGFSRFHSPWNRRSE